MKNKILILTRELPETNSSSSHSLVIKRGGNRITSGLPESLKVDSNAYSYSDSEYLHTILEKINYAMGLVGSYRNTRAHAERLQRLLLKETNTKSLRYQWIVEYFKGMMGDDSGMSYLEGPVVDHQSMDLYYDVWESDETLLDFILCPDSKVFLESDGDNHTFDTKTTTKASDAEAILVIDLGEPIGKVEIPIIRLSDKTYSMELAENEMDEILSCTYVKDGVVLPLQKEYLFGYGKLEKGELHYKECGSYSNQASIDKAVWVNEETGETCEIKTKLIIERFNYELY